MEIGTIIQGHKEAHYSFDFEIDGQTYPLTVVAINDKVKENKLHTLTSKLVYFSKYSKEEREKHFDYYSVIVQQMIDAIIR